MTDLDFTRPTALPRFRLLRRIFLLTLILFAAFLSYMSIVPIAAGAIEVSDKTLHFLAYGGLTGLLGLALPQTRLVFIFILACAIGAGLEFAQGYLPTGRTMSMGDQLANTGGAALAIISWAALVAGRQILKNRLG